MLSRYLVSQVKHNSFFIFGLILGLWLALAVVPLDDDPETCLRDSSTAAFHDDYEPHHEEKPLGSAGAAAGRSIQRPRYYSTELGMRGSLLSGVLSSESALTTRVAALNKTAMQLQPHLRFFITASTLQAAPGLANVVGFTDTREMLKPFHALKYLADNYLEEYDFFFLVSDASFINARRLTELVSKLSVSQDVYMGTVMEDDSHYCSLESGILLSNSVLRAVHNELDWCVRNSYSAHHHENLGRCVLHAAHLSCMSSLQAENYISLHLDSEDLSAALTPGLADAVTAHPFTEVSQYHQLHAYVSRVYLERDQEEILELRAALVRYSRRHPVGYRNATWPPGLRNDPGLAPPKPENRFDHLRWTTFNWTHALMPDDHHAVGLITGAHRKALDLVWDTVKAWALNRWQEASTVELIQGAYKWEPATALRYRLLIALTTSEETGMQRLVRELEVVRSLGAARLVPVPYVTESARLTLVLPVVAMATYGDNKVAMPTGDNNVAMPTAGHNNVVMATAESDVNNALKVYEAVALKQDKNVGLIVVIIRSQNDKDSPLAVKIKDTISTLASKYKGSPLEVIETALSADVQGGSETAVQRAAIAAVMTKISRDSLILLGVPHMEYNQDFLNRVRMNTISGWQFFSPVPFARYSQYSHPRFVSPDGSKPQQNTGRFNQYYSHVAAFYKKDYEQALTEYKGDVTFASVTDILTSSPLHCLRAPEPGLVLSPRPVPCPANQLQCLASHRDRHFNDLDLGAKQTLAKLLLEMQAEVS